jgi:hypothetical protein
MPDPQLRARLRRLADMALLVAFLALVGFSYGAFFATAGRMMMSPVPEFSDFYRAGQNPWAGASAEPAPQQRFAGAFAARRAPRPVPVAGNRR